MRLSEAILLGSVGTEQSFNSFYDNGRTCALGAALAAVGRLQTFGIQENNDCCVSFWPWAFLEKASCPLCKSKGYVLTMITHLNDIHHWTRPRIAEWVATVEPVEQPLVETVIAKVEEPAHVA